MDLSIIIINFNTSKYTINCIESIISNTAKGIAYEIIVIDNNSKIEDLLEDDNLENSEEETTEE